MVRINNFWVECLHRFGSLLRRHGVRQVHRNESDIDVLQRTHFRDIFGIARNIDAEPTPGHDVTVAAALIVKQLASGGSALEVVHGHSFDVPCPYGAGIRHC